jgi:hypothetical protein
MTVSAVSGAPAVVSAQQSSATRAADDDRLKPSVQTSQIKDNDGDYKTIAAANSPAASSSSGVQAALTLLKTGG